MRMNTEHQGRLVQAFWHKDEEDKLNTGVELTYSDDHGQTWNQGASVPNTFDGHGDFNEVAMAQADNGELVEIMRADSGPDKNNYQFLFRSPDGGETISETEEKPSAESSETRSELIQANQRFGDTAPKLIFLSIRTRNNGRFDLRAKFSYDYGDEFHDEAEYQIEPNETEYSAIDVMSKDRFLVVQGKGRDELQIKTFSLSDIYPNA
jgi:sialidase-1